MREEEQSLIRTINKGNTEAFQKLVEQYQRLVSSIVYKMIPQIADHEDLCQDVFFKVYKKLSSFRGDSKLSVWIGRITYTTCLNYLKKNSRRNSWSLDNTFKDENGHESPRELPALTSTPEQDFEQNELHGFLHGEVNRLSPEYRTALTLYHWQEMDYKEISEVMEIPVNTLKSYLFRARKELKNRLLKQYPREDSHEQVK